MAVYRCDVCDYMYDESAEGIPWADLPDDWVCPLCGSSKAYFKLEGDTPAEVFPTPSSGSPTNQKSSPEYRRASDDLETHMADIHAMAASGKPIIEPMRTGKPVVSWDDILIKGGQLARIPLNTDVPVNTQTVIGPNAKKPLVIETPIYVSHMSFGALSKEAKIALSKGSAIARTAIGSGEGGILPEEKQHAYRYIFEYVPNQYSVTEENLRAADAIEIKIGQSSKPGLGGHLPATKVTDEIAAIRGKPVGRDIISPAHFSDIRTAADLKNKVAWLREVSLGRPIGIKLAAGDIEADLNIAVSAAPDFITIDGRPGATGASPKFVKAATSVPTIFALYRARRFLVDRDINTVSLVITGGLRVPSDFAKALALGADAIAIASAAMMAIGCQQYRQCHVGKCPVGIATQDPQLRARLDVERAASGLSNYLSACIAELKDFARLTGRDDVHGLSLGDLMTTNSEISMYTGIAHV
ncbi:MAG: glutamate synthase-related protein [bacterium]